MKSSIYPSSRFIENLTVLHVYFSIGYSRIILDNHLAVTTSFSSILKVSIGIINEYVALSSFLVISPVSNFNFAIEKLFMRSIISFL
jgi:hypothetical protein